MQDKSESTFTHGGARKGSGRKATGKKTKCITLTLTTEQAEVLQSEAKYAGLSVSQYIVKELHLPDKYVEKAVTKYDFSSFEWNENLIAAEEEPEEYKGKE